jgi:hypothetical protein
MKRLGLLAVVLAVALSGSAAWADGDFYVISGGGPPVGTKITSVPYTITQPGFYYLDGNLNCTSGNGITIDAGHVTLDLMGFRISSPISSSGVSGIKITGPFNVEIRNGTVYGFTYGIKASNDGGSSYRISNVRAVFNNDSGISLLGKNHSVRNCHILNDYGLMSGIFLDSGLVNGCVVSGFICGIEVTSGEITGCVSSNNQGIGIKMLGAGSLIGNIANNNMEGFRIGTNVNLLVDRNSASGNSINYAGGDSKTVWGVNAGR